MIWQIYCVFLKKEILFLKKRNIIKVIFPPDKERYFETILNFMQKGPSAIPEYHHFAFLMQKRYGKQFFRDNSEKERFINIAHQHYHNNKSHLGKLKDPDKWKEVWNKEYKPILQAIREIKVMVDNEDYRKQQFQILIDNGLITDDVLRRSLKRHFKIVQEFFLESKNQQISENDVLNNPIILQYYKQFLLGKSVFR